MKRSYSAPERRGEGRQRFVWSLRKSGGCSI